MTNEEKIKQVIDRILSLQTTYKILGGRKELEGALIDLLTDKMIHLQYSLPYFWTGSVKEQGEDIKDLATSVLDCECAIYITDMGFGNPIEDWVFHNVENTDDFDCPYPENYKEISLKDFKSNIMNLIPNQKLVDDF